MKNTQKIINLYFRSIKRFEEMEHAPRDFGTGELLYSSEIHTLQAIGDTPNINLTTLAEKLGISKSGASKFTGKLLNKGLITKSKQINNDKEVVFHLTKDGYTAYTGHERYSSAVFKPVYDLLSSLDDDHADFLASFLQELHGAMDKIEDTL